MSDPLARRADAIHHALLAMERQASDEQLFPLGYLIPQIPLVMEMVEYDPEEVLAEDFDAIFQEWLEGTFGQDAMSAQDQDEIRRLLAQACAQADAA